MSSDGEEQFTMDQLAATDRESEKKSKISYTRDFLLSLSELDVCKKLPSGFDQSLLSGLEDASQDRQRIAAGSSLHSFRRSECGSSPPTRGDLGNYSRGVHGRWDTRLSGRSDKDSDSQSDWESDSGRRFGQSRRSWQGPEHDGLLGSGSFPRPSGYAAGASVPKLRTNDTYQLNRSNEPYHPPRPYKAAPHSRRETNDSYNDETFGSSESTSEDRAEEERKRRAAFELMRKEQQKALQEKQKSSAEKRKDDFDISTLMDDDKDDKGLSTKSNELDESVVPAANNESVKSTLQSQTPAARPLVPPGFSITILERNSGSKTSLHPHSSETGNSEFENRPSHLKSNQILSGTSGNQEEKSALAEKRVGNIGSNSVSNQTDNLDSQLYETPNLSEAFDASEKSAAVDLHTGVTGNKINNASDQVHSTSILDKLFGSAVTLNGSGTSKLVERHDSKADDMWSPRTVQSSKFAHWFLEEPERKPVDDLSSGRPNDLLSLIVGGESTGSQASDVNVSKHIQSSFPFESTELVGGHSSDSTPGAVENSEQLSSIIVNETGAVPAVLTCEDLEQSILSEISEKDPALPPPVQGWSVPDVSVKKQKPDIDDRASQHLLSLLQKGPGMKETASSPNLDIVFSDKLRIAEAASVDTVHNNSTEANAENFPSSGKPLALETLFGSAFMKELQSIGAPVSAQRGSLGSARPEESEANGLPFSVMEDGLTPSAAEISSISFESSVLASNKRERTKSDGIEEHLIGFDSPQLQMDSSRLQSQLRSKLGGFDGSAEVRLPEEDSLIAVSDPINPQNLMPARSSAKPALLSSPDTPVDIAEKLAALNSGFRDERSVVGGQEGPLFLRGPYDAREPNIPFHNLHIQPSSSQLHHPPANHMGQLFHPLDSHPANINTQIKFMAPDGIIHHDPQPNQQFPGNMLRPPFHHQSTGHTGFDPPAPHPMLQQMQMPGNFPPPHLLRGFSGGAPLPPQSNNQGPGFMPEVNPVQGFPFSQQQHNFPSLGIPPRAPEVGGGSDHPEAFQRLIEMELGLNSKQIHPFAAAAGRSQGMYGHELDMGFGYR